jgi:aconitate hydratase
MPSTFHIDDGMIVPPVTAAEAKTTEILRGPNIGAPPKNEALPAAIRGEVTLKVGDKITTDHIIPAGDRMKYRSNIPRYADFVFEPVDPAFAQRAAQLRDGGEHNVIVAGLSYGQGSSREHAAICPMYLGVKAVIAKSFERIHTANLINFGILPLTFRNEGIFDRIDQGDTLEIPAILEIIGGNKPLIVNNVTKDFSFEAIYDLSERQQAMILAGGALNLRS